MQNSETNTNSHTNINANEFASANPWLIAKLTKKVLSCGPCRFKAVKVGDTHKQEIEDKQLAPESVRAMGSVLWGNLCPECRAYAEKLLKPLEKKYTK